MTTFFCRNEHEGKLWPPPSCHTHPQWYDKLWNLLVLEIIMQHEFEPKYQIKYFI